VACCAALAASCSAGNAEPPLLLYETVALAAVLANPERHRFLAAVALCGAVLSKTEGALGAALILLGLAASGGRRWPPQRRKTLAVLALATASAAAGWLLLRLAFGLPLTDPIREPAFRLSFQHLGAILAAVPSGLAAGTRGLALLVPLAILAWTGARRWREAAPALTLAGGLLAFLGFYYLHVVGDPARLIGWTLPRVSIPALSALILAAGVTSGPVGTGERELEV
jgi:hypothetical protein